MTQYRLVAVAFREVTSRDAAGNVTGERRYRQGDVIDLTGSEEQRLLLAGALAPLGEPQEPETETDEGTDPETGEPSTGDTEKPKKASAVDDWREYAVGQGFDRDQVDEMTKAELVAAVG